jgi:hypothetical protein
MKILKIVLFSILSITISCQKSEPLTITPIDFHNSVDNLVNVMIHDIFSPPVASRVFVYPNIAAYEIIARENNGYKSLAGQLSGLTEIPEPHPESVPDINYQLAALIAHINLSKKLIFSENKVVTYRDSLYKVWENKNARVFNASKTYALKVVRHIEEWKNKDNYNETRNMPNFHLDTDDISRWEPTPPSYMNGVEPHWNKIRPLVLDSASHFKPIPPPVFSMKEGTGFYAELSEVYDVSNKISNKGDASEEIQIAQFWDCNPYVSVNRGHLMFATKKITPGAHWMGIAKIASHKMNYNFDETVYVSTITSIAIFDAFISCWDEKYRSNLVRPETLINRYFDDNWKPILQTPPFPEYTSGHSVVSGAASVILTSIFGDDFKFQDDTEVPYGLPIRSFNSFDSAADEAAISRLYGGIHYRSAIDVGIKQGRDLGRFVLEKLDFIDE